MTIAVWVGHADSVKPMLTEYGGAPVDGGTIPALIFHDVLDAVRVDEEERAGRHDHSVSPRQHHDDLRAGDDGRPDYHRGPHHHDAGSARTGARSGSRSELRHPVGHRSARAAPELRRRRRRGRRGCTADLRRYGLSGFSAHTEGGGFAA